MFPEHWDLGQSSDPRKVWARPTWGSWKSPGKVGLAVAHWGGGGERMLMAEPPEYTDQ